MHDRRGVRARGDPRPSNLGNFGLTVSSDGETTAFTNIVNMESEAIRQAWSTTPLYEAPWFSDELKQGACFAIAMAPVVTLSATWLVPVGERPFARMAAALARTR